MADQKISQLVELVTPLGTNVLPIVNSGETKKITVDNLLLSSSYEEGTYLSIKNKVQSGSLVPGKSYLITDYQTCYDQPNWAADGTAITSGSYRTASIEPLVVLAISSASLSPYAYSTTYPKDTIKYDINVTVTEATDNPAKGRIYERIDEVGNRTDYDWRSVVFKRYIQYYAQNTYSGKVTLNMGDTTGSIIGVETNFESDFSIGDVIGLFNPSSNRIGGFDFYEVVEISGSTYMGITGSYYNSISNTYYTRASSYSGYSPFQTNTITVGKDEIEYYTFESDGTPADDGWYNNYLGDNNDWEVFKLSNNVFRDGAYRDNHFDSNVIGNTFNDDCYGNKIGRNFQYNVIEDDFDNNTIGDSFRYNFSNSDFQENIIANNFEYNMLADDDGVDFNFNIINGDRFAHNWTIGYDHFHSNIITDEFYNNVFYDRFGNNLVHGAVNDNFFDGNTEYNQFKGSFYQNNLYDIFKNNIVGQFYGNEVLDTFERNQINGQAYYNIISGSFFDNTIGDSFYSNTFSGSAGYNQIGSEFRNNQVGDSFGTNGGTARGNKIGNKFVSNTIKNSFLSNTVADNFDSNTTAPGFQQNTIFADGVSNIDFTANYGNLVTVNADNTVIGGNDGTYTNVASTTNGIGVDGTFDIVVTSGVAGISINQGGKLYEVSDVVTITGSLIGGGSDLVMTVDTVSIKPVVYQYFDTTIVRNTDEDYKATYLTNSGFGWTGITQIVD